MSSQVDWSMRPTPFQLGRKSSHHWMSALALAFSLMRWWSFDTDVLRSISLLRKILPTGITLAAKERDPMRERSSLFVVFLVVRHCCSSAFSAASLSSGRRISNFTVSNRIPRKTRMVASPSIFPSAMGNPSCRQICSICARACSQSDEPGFPAMRKSSR